MNGVYGTKRPANITASDVDIFYYYRPDRSSESSDFSTGWKSLDTNVFKTCNVSGTTATLPGMYDLRLPLSIFSKTGFYNIYIKPKEIEATILQVSTLSSYSNVRGIVIDTTGMDELPTDDGALIGYRIEYFENNVRQDMFRIVTSNNKCEPVAQNLNNAFSNTYTYRFNSSSNLIFCTVSPSTSPSFKANDLPSIGTAGQKIVFVNTKFNPVMIEVEITDKDINSITTMLEGKQIRNLNKGIITTFDENGNIYHQASYGNIVNKTEGINHDFKIPSETIDSTEKDTLSKIEGEI